MDLTTQVPRSPYAELGAFPWLPRLIDKARATFAGTNGEYIYPCPMDERFLDFYGLDAGQLGDAIKASPDDAGVLSWVEAHAARKPEAEAQAFKRAFLYAPPESPEHQAYLAKLAAELGRPDVDTFAKLIAADEKHPVPSTAG